jgi:hypothetical protein
MKPVTVSIDVARRIEEVYSFLDELANHERFTNHMLVDWELGGPARGAGARARMRVKKPGRPDWLDLQVVATEPPYRTVEESVSAGGRRRTRGTYILKEFAHESTRVSFKFEWLKAPLAEQLDGTET